MRKTNGVVVQWSFEKLDFFFNYQSKSWLFNANIEQISNSVR